MNDLELTRLVAYTRVLWPHQPIPDVPQEVVVDAWRRLIGDRPAYEIEAAIDAFAAEGERFTPTVGQIRNRSIDLALVRSGERIPDTDQAWGEIKSEMSRVGYSGELDPNDIDAKPRFSHPAITTAVESMGWPYLCRSTDEMADRAHFLKLYAAAAQRTRSTSAMPPSVVAVLAGAMKALPE